VWRDFSPMLLKIPLIKNSVIAFKEAGSSVLQVHRILLTEQFGEQGNGEEKEIENDAQNNVRDDVTQYQCQFHPHKIDLFRDEIG